MLIVLTAAIFFTGCEKEAILIDESGQDGLKSATIKAAKLHTKFEGVCNLVSPAPINTWYDQADDSRVTGTSEWFTESAIPIDDITVELKGTSKLYVGGDSEKNDGIWEMSWHGTQTLTSQDGSSFNIVAHAVGVGTEGNVMGMTARWKYSMHFNGNPETLVYFTKGKITEAK